MTTGAMVLGAIPLALASGAGAESRQQIGWVIVGGMLLGTLLTLFVVPTIIPCWRVASVPANRRCAAADRPGRLKPGLDGLFFLELGFHFAPMVVPLAVEVAGAHAAEALGVGAAATARC